MSTFDIFKDRLYVIKLVYLDVLNRYLSLKRENIHKPHLRINFHTYKNG